MIWAIGQEYRYGWHILAGHCREKKHLTHPLIAITPVIHPYLFSFSCATLKAAGRDGWGLSVVAVVAPGCHHWGILASPALTTAQGHLWAYTRPLKDPGSSGALTASRPLAAQDSGIGPSHLDRPHRVQRSSPLDRGGVLQDRFRSGGMTTPQCQSMSAENQLFQKPHGETTSHSS